MRLDLRKNMYPSSLPTLLTLASVSSIWHSRHSLWFLSYCWAWLWMTRHFASFLLSHCVQLIFGSPRIWREGSLWDLGGGVRSRRMAQRSGSSKAWEIRDKTTQSTKMFFGSPATLQPSVGLYSVWSLFCHSSSTNWQFAWLQLPLVESTYSDISDAKRTTRHT